MEGAELEAHLRVTAERLCRVNDAPVHESDAISYTQYNDLQLKTPDWHHKSVEEKWIAVYTKLFPEDKRVSSPCEHLGFVN
jgi:hypothetical protein